MASGEGFFEKMQRERIEKISILNQTAKKGQILFTGSSLMQQFPINEILMTHQLSYIIYNRGVDGFRTEDMLAHMEEMVFGTEPSKIFINIGTNDIAALDFDVNQYWANYTSILKQIRKRLPETEVYVMAYYPVNEVDKIPEGEWGKIAFVNRNNKTIDKLNVELEAFAEKMGVHFINVNAGLSDERGKLKKEFTVEGIHMYANAYEIIFRNMEKYF